MGIQLPFIIRPLQGSRRLTPGRVSTFALPARILAEAKGVLSRPSKPEVPKVPSAPVLAAFGAYKALAPLNAVKAVLQYHRARQLRACGQQLAPPKNCPYTQHIPVPSLHTVLQVNRCGAPCHLPSCRCAVLSHFGPSQRQHLDTSANANASAKNVPTLRFCAPILSHHTPDGEPQVERRFMIVT
jgi:hypothetical protein